MQKANPKGELNQIEIGKKFLVLCIKIYEHLAELKKKYGRIEDLDSMIQKLFEAEKK